MFNQETQSRASNASPDLLSFAHTSSLMFSQVVATSLHIPKWNLLSNEKKQANLWQPTFPYFLIHPTEMVPKIICSTPWHTGAKSWATESWSALSKAKTRLKHPGKGTGSEGWWITYNQCRFLFGDLWRSEFPKYKCVRLPNMLWDLESFSWWKKMWLRAPFLPAGHCLCPCTCSSSGPTIPNARLYDDLRSCSTRSTHPSLGMLPGPNHSNSANIENS